MRRARIGLPIILAALLAAPGLSATINVPADYPTIQKAIDAALDGDTVLVQPGKYDELIDFWGKAITVKSSQGPHVTIIDGSEGEDSSVVRFTRKEGNDSILEGFTIVGGTGTPWNHWPLQSICGGGIFCEGASPTIRNNIIRDNEATTGGGICCWFYSSPRIENNLVMLNSASHGGGIMIEWDCDPVLHNNIIVENTAMRGGGICCHSNESAPRIINCAICNNSASIHGGGLKCVVARPVVSNSIFWNNDAPTGKEMRLAGITKLTIDYCDVEGGKDSVSLDAGSKIFWGDHMIDADPLFVNPAGQNFHLTRLSPCINRGGNSEAPPKDFDGDPRPCMGTADMGADEYIDLHSLEADLFELAEGKGGKVQFTLDAGLANSGRTYLMLGSVTGTAPGSPLPGGQAVLPLNWDYFTCMVWLWMNGPVFQNFHGALSKSGNTYATFDTQGPLPTGSAGRTFSFAFVLDIPWDYASNPIDVTIIP